jgi:hypothetical protein
MDDQRTDREGSFVNPFKLMGPNSYTRMVKILRLFDQMISECNAERQTAADRNDEATADKSSQAIEKLKEFRSEWEELMRETEPGDRNNYPTA